MPPPTSLFYTFLLALVYFCSLGKAHRRVTVAFVPSPKLDASLYGSLRHSSDVTNVSKRGIDTRITSASFEIGSLQDDVAYFLDSSSQFLYNSLSQGSCASPSECLMASAAYVLPLMDSVENFGEIAKPHMPGFVQLMIARIHELSQFYSSVPFLSYTMSTLIYSCLVKKDKLEISYFLRYHFLQSLILSSFQNSFAMFYFKLLPLDVSSQDFIAVVSTMSAAITSFGSVLYCVFHALMGRLANLPVISDAVKLHIGKEPSSTVSKKLSHEEDENAEDEQ